SARLSSLVNNANGQYRVETLVDIGSPQNSPPVSSMAPVVQFPNGAIDGFQIPAVDPNVDPLTFRFPTSLAGSGLLTGYTQPAGLQLSSSGLLTWNLTSGFTTGSVYSAQVMIEDHSSTGAVKSKTPVDFLIQIVAPTSSNHAPTVSASPAGPFNPQPGQ